MKKLIITLVYFSLSLTVWGQNDSIQQKMDS